MSNSSCAGDKQQEQEEDEAPVNSTSIGVRKSATTTEREEEGEGSPLNNGNSNSTTTSAKNKKLHQKQYQAHHYRNEDTISSNDTSQNSSSNQAMTATLEGLLAKRFSSSSFTVGGDENDYSYSGYSEATSAGEDQGSTVASMIHLMATESYNSSCNSFSEHQFGQFSNNPAAAEYQRQYDLLRRQVSMNSDSQRKQVRFSFDDEDSVTAFFSSGGSTTANGSKKDVVSTNTSASRSSTISSPAASRNGDGGTTSSSNHASRGSTSSSSANGSPSRSALKNRGEKPQYYAEKSLSKSSPPNASIDDEPAFAGEMQIIRIDSNGAFVDHPNNILSNDAQDSYPLAQHQTLLVDAHDMDRGLSIPYAVDGPASVVTKEDQGQQQQPSSSKSNKFPWYKERRNRIAGMILVFAIIGVAVVSGTVFIMSDDSSGDDNKNVPNLDNCDPICYLPQTQTNGVDDPLMCRHIDLSIEQRLPCDEFTEREGICSVVYSCV